MKPRLLFFVGKGGVGKSTLSALTALSHEQKGHSVLLLSLDPAHNLSDLFGQGFGDSPTAVSKHLAVMEADITSWIADYLKQVQRNVQRTYTYLTAFNLEHHFRVLRHSPGLEEFALRRILQHVLESERNRDVIVVDMPPTALATRFFASPSISNAWTEELLKLRRAIKQKRDMITRIQVGSKTIEQDRVLSVLEKEQKENQALRDLYADAARCSVNLVVNPDLLSWKEGVRIHESLTEVGISLRSVLLNKATGAPPNPPDELIHIPFHAIPAVAEGPIGEVALRDCLSNIPHETLISL
jgi:arsenite-transporting ATPase